MTLQEYLDALRGKTVAVIGIGVSNTPLIEMLCAAGIRVIACDKRERASFGEEAAHLESLGARLQLGTDYLQALDADVIFRTPGMRPDVPQLLAARERGSVITSEMQAFFEVCPCTILAVTGSDGKTTTTTLIAQLLRAAGETVYVGGNIGHPLLCEAGRMEKDACAVLELSSFQLMDMPYSPHIAVMTNLAPNHLDVHKDMAEYIAAKENIFRHQSASDIAIFNGDNAITRQLAGKAQAQVRHFGRQSAVAEGVCLTDGVICAVHGGACRAVLPIADIRLPGMHNVENYMAAIAAVDGIVPDEVIRQVAGEFCGVPHRIEFVREVRGVRYYNDSIASSPTRAIAGLRSFDRKLIMIAGGYDKHLYFTELGAEIVSHVKCLVLCGDTAQAIRAAVTAAPGYREGVPEIVTVDDFDRAVALAAQRAVRGDVVILCPASASFDRFRNFEVRGDHFKELVARLPE